MSKVVSTKINYKKDIARELAEKEGISKVEAERRIDAFLDIVTEKLEKHEAVYLNGFFNFTIRERDAKEAVNPKTGEKTLIPAVRSVHGKATKPLKERVQGKR